MVYIIVTKVIYLLRNLRNKILRTYAEFVINNKPPFIVFDAKGMKFFVKEKDALDQLLLSDKGFDNGLPYELNDLLDTKVGCAVDVGANVGYYAIPFSQNFEPVYAFEPNPNIREKLRENISLNSIANISTYPFAVGAHNKKSDFFCNSLLMGITTSILDFQVWLREINT